MHGLMMDQPLLISDLIRHADRHHGDTEIVTKTVEDGSDPPLHLPRGAPRARGAWRRRWRRWACSMNDRVATLAWNGYRHFEIYYATAGSGARDPHHQPAPVPRADRLHRQPRRGHGAVLRHQPRAAGREARAAAEDGQGLRGDDRPRHMPKANIPNLHCYEELIDAAGRRFRVAVLRRAAPPPACATPRAPPAIRRARSTATARPCCTPTPRRCPTRSTSRRAT